MHGGFTYGERIRRLLVLARRAELEGRSRQARNLRRMARDLLPFGDSPEPTR